MSIQDDFYVFLTSNVKPDIGMQVKNEIGNFYTHLPEKLQLSNEWEVALADITYTKSWFNLNKKEEIYIAFTDKNTRVPGMVEIEPGNYGSVNDFLTTINIQLSKFKTDNEIFIDKTPHLDISSLGKINLHLGKKTFITSTPFTEANVSILPLFSQNLCDILGLIDSSGKKLDLNNYQQFQTNVMESIEPTILTSKYNPQINSIHTLYVYTDIIKPRIVGNRKAPLLRQVEIPSKINYGDDCFIKYKNRFYHPLNHHEIDKLQIIFRDDTGNIINFKFGRTTLTLHFKRKNNFYIS